MNEATKNFLIVLIKFPWEWKGPHTILDEKTLKAHLF